MLELLTSALMAGTIAGITSLAAEAIKDAYTGLKNAIISKFGKVKGPLEILEEDPTDEVVQKLVSNRIAEAGVDADADVQAAADKLRAALKMAGMNLGGVTQTATGDGNIQVTGTGNTTYSNFSKGNTGVNVQGSTVQGSVSQGDTVARDKIGRQVNTSGGTYVEGSVSAQGDFVGRDKIVHNHNVAPELSAIPSDARALVPLLNQYFGLSDIDSVCFEMGIDDEQLRGQTKDEKARSLVKFVEENGRLDELKKLMRMARPNLRTQLS